MLAWRYGARGAFWTILPPIIAALLVPAVISLGGEPFTFFHAMGLVLVVAIGVDYTIFCAETPRGHHSVTMLAILLATITTLLSFGLLGCQQHPRRARLRLHHADRHHRRLPLRPAGFSRGHTGPVQMIVQSMPSPLDGRRPRYPGDGRLYVGLAETASSAVPAPSAFLGRLRPPDLGREFEAVQLVTVSRDDKVRSWSTCG